MAPPGHGPRSSSFRSGGSGPGRRLGLGLRSAEGRRPQLRAAAGAGSSASAASAKTTATVTAQASRIPSRRNVAAGVAGSSSAAGAAAPKKASLIKRNLAKRRKERQAAGLQPALGELEEVVFPPPEAADSADAGAGASVRLFQPKQRASEAERAKLYGRGGALGGLYSRVVWPSGQALARRLLLDGAEVRGKRVVELGCGLGLPACAAAAAGAGEVVVADFDGQVAAAAAESVRLNTAAPVAAVTADWNKPAEWPTDFDVALGADVLYDSAFPPAVAATCARVLAGGAETFALLADPVVRPYRAAFEAECRKVSDVMWWAGNRD